MVRIFNVVGYKCIECGIVFDAKMEYVKAMEHGMNNNHKIESVQEEQSEEDYDREYRERQKKYFAELNKDILPDTQSDLNDLDSIPFKENKKKEKFKYGYIDVDI